MRLGEEISNQKSQIDSVGISNPNFQFDEVYGEFDGGIRRYDELNDLDKFLIAEIIRYTKNLNEHPPNFHPNEEKKYYKPSLKFLKMCVNMRKWIYEYNLEMKRNKKDKSDSKILNLFSFSDTLSLFFQYLYNFKHFIKYSESCISTTCQIINYSDSHKLITLFEKFYEVKKDIFTLLIEYSKEIQSDQTLNSSIKNPLKSKFNKRNKLSDNILKKFEKNIRYFRKN